MQPPITWEKKGLIYTPSSEGGWMHTHGQIPTVITMEDCIRVFFASRPRQNLSLPACLDLDLNDPTRVLKVYPDVLLDVGTAGSFDQHGVMPSSVIAIGDAPPSESEARSGGSVRGRPSPLLWLYYSGWCREVDVPYNNTIGLATSTDGGKHFTRKFTGPVVGRSRFDPFNASSPYVMKEGKGWHMWYSSGTEFYCAEDPRGVSRARSGGDLGESPPSKKIKYEPVYLLRYASSANGIDWTIRDRPIIPTLSRYEAQTRPSVIRIGHHYHMWFSFRDSEDYRGGAGSYRMGYAISENGIDWQRNDALAGIDVSSSGWDSEMIAYPYIIPYPHKPNHYLMFYNGNDFGKEGFGLAVGRI